MLLLNPTRMILSPVAGYAFHMASAELVVALSSTTQKHATSNSAGFLSMNKTSNESDQQLGVTNVSFILDLLVSTDALSLLKGKVFAEYPLRLVFVLSV